MHTARACGVAPRYLPPPPPSAAHPSRWDYLLHRMVINQLYGWQLGGVKYWVDKEKTTRKRQMKKEASERGRFKIHPGAMWESYEPPFPGCQGCV